MVICTAPSQSIPAGEEVTLPCPSPAVVMDKVNVSGGGGGGGVIVGGVVVAIGGVVVGGVVVAVGGVIVGGVVVGGVVVAVVAGEVTGGVKTTRLPSPHPTSKRNTTPTPYHPDFRFILSPPQQ